MKKQTINCKANIDIALGEIAVSFFNDGSLKSTHPIMLKKAKELTGSVISIIAHIDTVTGELINTSCDSEQSSATQECTIVWNEVEVKRLLDLMIFNRKSCLINNTKASLKSYENLINNLPIQRFISSPIFEKDQLVGFVIAANACTGYTIDDVSALEQLTNLYGKGLRHWNENKNLNLFRRLVDQSSDAIYVVDPKSSRFLECNEAAYTLLGYEREEFLAKRVIDISLTDPDLDTWQHGVDSLRTVPYSIFEGKQIHKNGTILPVEVNVRLIRQDSKEYIVSMARDIRDRRNLPMQLSKKGINLKRCSQL